MFCSSMSIINNVLSKVIGSRNDRLIKKYSGQVAKINALEPQMVSMSDDELSSITARLKQRAKNNEKYSILGWLMGSKMEPKSFQNLIKNHVDFYNGFETTFS